MEAAILDCRIHKILLADSVRRAQTHVCQNIIKIVPLRQYCDFANFLYSVRRHLGFTKSWIFICCRYLEAQTHHCTNFHQNRSFHCRDIAIYRIFKMAAVAILDFWNCEILLVTMVGRAETYQHAKFCQNRSIGCEDSNIFRFFKMAAAAVLYFQNREFLFAVSICRSQTHHCSKFRQTRGDNAFFSNFQDGCRRYLGFLKWRNFIGYCGPERGKASVCQILSKSVNRLQRY